MPEIGYFLGLYHDWGKYSSEFQAHVRATQPAKGSVVHSGAGAELMLAELERAHPGDPYIKGLAARLAHVITAHHAGLTDDLNARRIANKRRNPLAGEVRDCGLQDVPEALVGLEHVRFPSFLLPKDTTQTKQERKVQLRSNMEFFTRIALSLLVDADRLDAEEHELNGRRSVRARRKPSMADLHEKLTTHMTRMAERAPASDLNTVRDAILKACLAAAEGPQGFTRMTVPTGGGKTLAGMSFALKHAVRYGLRRVVVAVPFTTITDQTTTVYRNIFGGANVLEHHSARRERGGPGMTAWELREDEMRTRLACENWDSPIVVTTTVQLLESLFTCSATRSRKLHNLARSVIIIDEVQALPLHLLDPILDGLRFMVECLDCTIVLSTATQPALEHRDSMPLGIRDSREIADPEGTQSFEVLRRVRVEWLGRGRSKAEWVPVPYTVLAQRIVEHSESSLSIVHRRKDAQILCKAIDHATSTADTVMLSTMLVPKHRKAILANVRVRLSKGEHVRVVSTQLIEAGVDVDFPIVYRSLAGLDSLTQAAGRCNREGKLKEGVLYVYLAETDPPPGFLRTALNVAHECLASGDVDLFSRQGTQPYFRKLTQLGGALHARDKKRIQESRMAGKYQQVDKDFRMIDSLSEPLCLVLDDEMSACFARACHANRNLEQGIRVPGEWTVKDWRTCQDYTVNVFENQAEALEASFPGDIVRLGHLDTTFFVGAQRAYHPRFGLEAATNDAE